MNPDNKELMDMIHGAPARSSYPRVAWEHPGRGLRAVEFRDEDEGKVVVGLEIREGYDLTGKPIWHRVNPCNERQMEVVVRAMLRDLSPYDPAIFYGRHEL